MDGLKGGMRMDAEDDNNDWEVDGTGVDVDKDYFGARRGSGDAG